MRYDMIVIGVSAGGLQALSTILPHLPCDFVTPIMIVQHISKDADSYLVKYLNDLCTLPVIEPYDKLTIQSGTIYIAPPGYHMLVEDKNTIALSIFPKVNYSQPSIDVLFESAADVFKNKLLGVILTGANSDGAKGVKRIKSHGGFVIVQSPKTSEAKIMPSEAIKAVKVDKILDLEEIGPFLKLIGCHHEYSE